MRCVFGSADCNSGCNSITPLNIHLLESTGTYVRRFLSFFTSFALLKLQQILVKDVYVNQHDHYASVGYQTNLTVT